MFFYLIEFFFVSTFLVLTQCSDQKNSTISTQQTGNSTVETTQISFNETEGRSLLQEIPRQGRIVNDEKISIKGFIPIVGFANEDGNQEKNKKDQSQVSSDSNHLSKFIKNDGTLAYENNYPQHMARPEDQRYIGAALQGLLGNMNSLRKPGNSNFLSSQKSNINRKSDCICVPFYLCRNGYLSTESSSIPNRDLSSLYQRRQPEQTETDLYSLINERSGDNLNLNDTDFAEKILGRMISGKSVADGCGLLRTCCQRIHSNQMIATDQPSFDHITSSLPSPVNGLISPHISSFQSLSSYRPLQEDYFQPGLETNKGNRPNRPPKLINVPSQLSPSYDDSFSLSIKNDPLSSLMVPPQIAYSKCGARQSIGINGRVQNLNYHQSSAEFAEFPWQVAILKRIGPSDNLYVCGGALINSDFVLTAAHCIKKFQSQDLKIRFGEWDVHREDEFYPYVEKNVEEIFVHPNFIPRNLMNDVALLKIDTEIDFNQHPHISPICLPDQMESFTGQRCFVSGWGKNSFGHQGEYQSVLMKVDLPVLDSRVCENLLKRTKLGYQFRLDRSMICAGGEPGKDACEGDGGSGLVCDVNGIWKVSGLVSWGLGCGQASIPGVYTNVGHIRYWIDRIISSHSSAKSSIIQNDQFKEIINERSFNNNDNSTMIESVKPSSNSTKNS